MAEDLQHEVISEILHAHAGAWLIDAARAAETAGEAEAVLRYHLVGAMGGRHQRRWHGERTGVVVFLRDDRVVIPWKELATAARESVAA